MKENQRTFAIKLGRTSKEISVLAPDDLLSESIYLSLNRFRRDPRVSNEIERLDEKDLAKIITARDPKGRAKIVGVSFPSSNR